MKMKGIINWVFVIFLAWTFAVVFINSRGQQTKGFIDATLGELVSKENIVLQQFCEPLEVSASVKSGSYNDTQIVNLKTSHPISTIYYTLDGTEPTAGGKYQSSVKIYGSETLTFVAVNLLTGAKSSIGSETYLLPSMIERMIIECEKYDHILIQEIKSEVNKLDSIVLKRLFTQDVRIKLVSSLRDEPKLQSYSIPEQALAVYFNQIIYVNCNQHQFDGMVSTYLHELGHAYDCNYRINGKMLSEQSEFQSFWLAESLALLPNVQYINTSSIETFAQCFALFYYSDATKQLLKSKAPQIYSYLEKVTK